MDWLGFNFDGVDKLIKEDLPKIFGMAKQLRSIEEDMHVMSENIRPMAMDIHTMTSYLHDLRILLLILTIGAYCGAILLIVVKCCSTTATKSPRFGRIWKIFGFGKVGGEMSQNCGAGPPNENLPFIVIDSIPPSDYSTEKSHLAKPCDDECKII